MQAGDKRGPSPSLGVTSKTLEPKSVEDVAEMVRSTGTSAIAAIGSGSHLGLGNPAAREDIALRMRGLNRIVDYVPEDQVVVVEAGITLGELQAELEKHGQRLAVDSMGGDGATIGGMLATNAYGASALRYGTLKDLIVGVELVRADGVAARAGGKVVKNVAGFDVSKLVVGSLGTLAIVTKATFRVHPLPEVTRRLRFRAKIDRVFPFVLALREAQLEPAAISVQIKGAIGADARGRETAVEIVFEGFGPGVDAQSKTCEEVAMRAGIGDRDGGSERNTVSERTSGSNFAPVVIPSDVEGQRQSLLKATFPPTEFERVAREVEGEALAYPSLGVMHFSCPSTSLGITTGGVAAALKLRELFESLGGTLIVQDMPDAWRGQIDAWGTPPPSFKLMRALKERFDPEYRLNPGRFVGGL